MATNKTEGFLEKAKEFFWQSKPDWEYEQAGGDSRVPMDERTNDPKADAQRFAAANGEENPYPDHSPSSNSED